MSKINVEVIMNHKVKFNEELDYQIVQLMMQSEFVTINSNTIQVEIKEVTSKGVVRFFGNKIILEQ